MIDDTAYPALPEKLSRRELEAHFSFTVKERKWVEDSATTRSHRACLGMNFKLFQRLGYTVPLEQVDLAVFGFVSAQLGVPRPSQLDLKKYDKAGTRGRHLGLAMARLGLSVCSQDDLAWLMERARDIAKIKQELPDIINAMIEELSLKHLVLPGLSILEQIATSARDQISNEIFERACSELTAEARDSVEALWQTSMGRSDWDQLKREPKRPTTREVTSFLQHIKWLGGLAKTLPALDYISPAKRAHLTLEARAHDAASIQSIVRNKALTLAMVLIQAQQRKANDDIAEIFVKTMRKLDGDAGRALEAFQLASTEQSDKLITQLLGMLRAYGVDEADAFARILAIKESLTAEPEELITECEEHLAFKDRNYFPFMVRPYAVKRSLLFQCLDVLQFRLTYQDPAFEDAMGWVSEHRNSHKEFLTPERKAGGSPLNLKWLPRKWKQLIVIDDPDGEILVDRKYLEIAVFLRIQEELQSGDLFVPNSEQFDDYRDNLVEEEIYQRELPDYATLVGLPTTAAGLVADLRKQLEDAATKANDDVENNESIAWGPAGLIIRKPATAEAPIGLQELDDEINKGLGQVSIIDVLTETVSWLRLDTAFGPLSGQASRLEDRRERFIATLFCYGCNMGASQTARSLKGFSRKQISRLNIHAVTEERLDKAIVKVINAYNKFALPKFWGTGKRTAADGTKWAMWEKNLLTEYHIRYGGFGGIGYYHVSDTYIALFSHFIPCGVYEAVYILDGLMSNESDIKPDTVHGDTQAQSTPVFGLSHLLGIKLMPRIRNIRELVFYKPDKRTKYPNIEQLFKGEAINWSLIENHYDDLMRIAVSIKLGKITPSTLLRRLGTASRKNKVYFAFRELGRVIRTIYLLRYISDPELRHTINAETNKAEEFHQFAKWSFFGGEGIMAENVRHEQRKIIKYNHLVSNLVALNTLHRMTKVIYQLQQSGRLVVTEKLLRALSPYRTIHINRYGDYLLDVLRPVEPMSTGVKFKVVPVPGADG